MSQNEGKLNHKITLDCQSSFHHLRLFRAPLHGADFSTTPLPHTTYIILYISERGRLRGDLQAIMYVAEAAVGWTPCGILQGYACFLSTFHGNPFNKLIDHSCYTSSFGNVGYAHSHRFGDEDRARSP